MSGLQARPAPAPPRPWHFPAFERREVAGGRVLTAHLPGKPLGVVSLVLDAGAMTEPEGRSGVSEILARCLSEGAGSYDAYGFAVAGERRAASWFASSGWDGLRAGFEAPVDELGAAAELLASAVREPRLAASDVERIRDERLDEIMIEASTPAARGMTALSHEVFADTSRYSRPDAGDAESVRALDRDALVEFAAQRLLPDAATLVVVGDLETVDVDALAATVFAGWTGQQSSSAPATVAARRTGRRVVVVDRPGSVQSMLLTGHDAAPRSAPDYVATTTMSLVLGGMFTSRLNLRLREEKGYAYGAHAGYDTRRDGGLFSARSAVQSDVTVPALLDLVATIESTHTGGVTTTETEAAVAYRAGVFPIMFAGPLSVASGLSELVTHGFDDDHFDRLREQVLAMTAGDLDAAARDRLRPDDLVSVVVGDAGQFLDALSAESQLGPVEVIADQS